MSLLSSNWSTMAPLHVDKTPTVHPPGSVAAINAGKFPGNIPTIKTGDHILFSGIQRVPGGLSAIARHFINLLCQDEERILYQNYWQTNFQ